MRKLSMETFTQSRKRKGESPENSTKKKRPVGSDTISYLKEKAELDAELKREEMKIRWQNLMRSEHSRKI